MAYTNKTHYNRVDLLPEVRLFSPHRNRVQKRRALKCFSE